MPHDNAGCWTSLVASGMDMHVAEAPNDMEYAGTSLDYMCCHQWRWAVSKMRRGDRIIAVLTDPLRAWLNYDDPKWTWSKHDEADHSWHQAAIDYYLYLHRPSLMTGYLPSWFHHLDSVAAELGSPAIVLDAFIGTDDGTSTISSSACTNIIRGNRTLQAISNAEFSDQLTLDFFTHKIWRDMWFDPRKNHLCAKNHQMLAHKILAAWRDDAGLDISNGFVEHVISISDMSDDAWYEQQSGLVWDQSPAKLATLRQRLAKRSI